MKVIRKKTREVLGLYLRKGLVALTFRHLNPEINMSAAVHRLGNRVRKHLRTSSFHEKRMLGEDSLYTCLFL